MKELIKTQSALTEVALEYNAKNTEFFINIEYAGSIQMLSVRVHHRTTFNQMFTVQSIQQPDLDGKEEYGYCKLDEMVNKLNEKLKELENE